MADEQTRQDVVEENIEAVETKYGDENWVKLLAVCLKDISVSLAMLVDNSSSST
jgi:hypothetical protein